MKFSTRSRYGLRFMVDLAVNYDYFKPVPLNEIAERQELSEGYLEQLVTIMRKEGLIRSIRGAKGGYMLAKSPEEITAGDVIRCLEGPLKTTDCVMEDCPEPCGRAEICVTRTLWENIRKATASILDNTTLKDLYLQAEQIKEARKPIIYDI
ncbi:Iron-sulfur cluster regulator IscR [Candidatus Syntrophocurvum alkaliphilum]|uniref:Iron-sulfur cluster regulator IscR n=1 Tax=Candidatus Syntrophocurvum alkaliphilum TaxID=2293317 RepID=A0A6I6DDT0_9FIRM|nr:Rrf2 family transcriptional regulator [Candidatus Syntrophocurvum alkaliphilum]QGT98701.1 Iron-sulfur cluster regulator IscR [Candidatus Syntrophocurvum alkaliphilum]